MATTVRELVTNLGFSVEDKGLKKYEAGLKRASQVATRVAGAAVAAGTAIFALGKKTAETAGRLRDASDITSLTVEEYQATTKWADQVGLAHSRLDQVLGRINQRINETAHGSNNYRGALESLGYTSEEIASDEIDRLDVLKRLREGIQDATTESEYMAIATKLLGKNASRQMMPALRNGTVSIEEMYEAQKKSGDYMTTEQAAAAEDFDRSMAKVNRAVEGLAMQIGLELLPIAEDMVEEFNKFVEEHGDKIRNTITDIADGFKEVADFMGGWGNTIKTVVGIVVGLKLVGIIYSVVTAMAALNAVILANPIVLAITAAVVAIASAAIFIVRNWDAIKDVAGKTLDYIKEKVMSVVGFFTDSWDKAKEMFSSFGESLKDTASGAFSFITDSVTTAFEWYIDTITGALNFLLGIPGRIIDAFVSMGSTLFKTAKGIGSSVKNAFLGMIPNWVITLGEKAGLISKEMAEGIRGGSGMSADDLDRTVTPDVGRDIGRDVYNSTSTRTKNVNANVTANLQVPAGTSSQQQEALRQQVDQMFDEKLDKAIGGALADNEGDE